MRLRAHGDPRLPDGVTPTARLAGRARWRKQYSGAAARFDVGEVADQDALCLGGQELPPALPSPPRSRVDAGPAQDQPGRRRRSDGRARPTRHGSSGNPSRDSRRPSAAPAAGRSDRLVAGRLDAERSSGGEPGRDASAARSPAPRTAGASGRAAPAGSAPPAAPGRPSTAGVGRPAAEAPPADGAAGGSQPPWTARCE